MSRKRTRIKVQYFIFNLPNTNTTIFYFRKQRHSVTGATLSVNPTMNSDSGNVSQDEHDDDQERYFDKIERLKRTENEVIYSYI